MLEDSNSDEYSEEAPKSLFWGQASKSSSLDAYEAGVGDGEGSPPLDNSAFLFKDAAGLEEDAARGRAGDEYDESENEYSNDGSEDEPIDYDESYRNFNEPARAAADVNKENSNNLDLALAGFDGRAVKDEFAGDGKEGECR